jgi:hypothetical protein
MYAINEYGALMDETERTEPKYWDRNLSQFHFIHYKPYTN